MKIYLLRSFLPGFAVLLSAFITGSAGYCNATPVVFKTVVSCRILEGLTGEDAVVVTRAKARHDLYTQVARSWCNKLKKEQGELPEEKRKAIAGLARGVLKMEILSSNIFITPEGKEVQIKAAITYFNEESFQRARKLRSRADHLRRWMRSAQREKELLEKFEKIKLSQKRNPKDLKAILCGLKALELNDQALRIWPEDPGWQELSKAEELLTKALGLDGGYFGLYLNRGDVRAIELEAEKAVADYEVAIRLNPRCVKAYSMLAMIYAGWYNLPKNACFYAQKACKLGDCGALDFLRELGDCIGDEE